MAYDAETLQIAQDNLMALRDNAMFDKLAQAYELAPRNKKEAEDIIALADQLDAQATTAPSRFAAFVKEGQDAVPSRQAQLQEEQAIAGLARKLAEDTTDTTLLESARVVATAMRDG